jgi:SAM-dependent methyltransferase
MELVKCGRLDLEGLVRLTRRPALFTPHDAPFWNDPHIASQMLEAHLDPNTDAASRRPETIERCVIWLMEELALRPGARLLDLGCGPGLYAERFAARGVRVTGMDLSAGSLTYARNVSEERGLGVRYVEKSYLTLDDEAAHDAIILIYFDLGALPPATRDDLLQRIRRALRPGGRFAFDVKTPAHPRAADGATRWQATTGPGFWRPHPCLELHQTFWYPDTATEFRQHTIVDPDGRATVYRVWDQTYTPDTITETLSQQRFAIRSLHADLAGAPWQPDAPGLGVVAEAPA